MNSEGTYTSGGYAEWKQKRKIRLGMLRLAIFLLCAAVAVVGLLLLIFPTMKVRDVVVRGNVRFSEAEIVEASGITVGDEIFALDLGEIADRIQRSYPVGVRISKSTSKVTIEITERGSLCISYAGHWFLLDSDLTVVRMSDNESDFAAYPRLVLPAVEQLSVGKPVQFHDDGIDRGYITELTRLLEEAGLFSHVTYLDVSEKYHVSYILQGKIRVVLGKVSDMETKMELTEQILGARFENDSPYAIVDVSDLKKTTYRTMQSADQLLTY